MHRCCRRVGETVDGAFDDRRSLIGKPIDLRMTPVQLQPAWILVRSRVLLLNAIDRPQNVGFGDLRRWATDHVPTAGIGNQQAAIGIFNHIGWMKVSLIAFQQRTS